MTPGQEPLPLEITTPAISNREIISRVIEARYSDLQVSVQVLVARSGYAEGRAQIEDVADDLLHDSIEAALASADKFDPSRPVYSWLLGIANNKLRERRRDARYDKERVQVFVDSDSGSNAPVEDSPKELIDDATSEERIDTVLFRSTNRSLMEDQIPEMDEMLALVKEDDRHILRLAIVEGLSGADLAAVFGIREGAAYVRLARAKERLRKKYLYIQAGKE